MSKRPDPSAFARAAGAPDPANPRRARAAAPARKLHADPAPEPPPAGALAVRAPDASALAPGEADGQSLTPYIDAHGFDPANYRWIPVRRRARKDGWSEAKQRLFIEELADTGCVETAARAVGMSVQSAYALRRAPGGEPLAAAWAAAIQQAALKLVDIAYDRAIHGSDEPVFDKAGNRVGRRMRQNDRLLMFLLRAHLPERYRHAHRDVRAPGELPPPELPRLAEAIARLEPVTPPDPHLLLPPDDLDVEVAVADIGNGQLPRYYRPDAPPYETDPVDEAFERDLEAAKREAWGLPPEDENELGDWDESWESGDEPPE